MRKDDTAVEVLVGLALLALTMIVSYWLYLKPLCDK